MKLLFYINQLYSGGAERVMSILASTFSAHGYQVVVVTSFCEAKEYPLHFNVERLSLEDAEIKRSFLKRNTSRIWKLRKICKTEKPDIVISFMGEPNFRALLATQGLRIKNLISVRADPECEYRGHIRGFLARHLLPITDGCVFQTKGAKQWFPAKLQKKSKVICNPVKEEFYQAEYRPVPGRIVSCGRLEKEKNFAMLVDAFARLAAARLEMQLMIYGEGSLRGELWEQIEKRGMEGRIFLMGAIGDVSKALSEASIFVLSSLSEGMPNALMEAMAVGVPCIATDCPCGGPRMLIDSGKNGILVKNNDAVALTHAIERLLNNPAEAAALGARAKERAMEYRQERVFREWQKYVDELLASGRGKHDNA